MTSVLCTCGGEVKFAEGAASGSCTICRKIVLAPSVDDAKAPDIAILEATDSDSVIDDLIVVESESETPNENELAESPPKRKIKRRRKRSLSDDRHTRSWLSQFDGLQIPTPIDLVGSIFLFTAGGVIIGFRLAHSEIFSYIGLAIWLVGFIRLYRIAALKKD